MMLDFAEQTGSGIVIMVWSFLTKEEVDTYLYRRIHGFYAFSSTVLLTRVICNK
jgi:hypothetical protein